MWRTRSVRHIYLASFLPSSEEGGALRRRPLWDFRMAIAKDGLAKFFESA